MPKCPFHLYPVEWGKTEKPLQFIYRRNEEEFAVLVEVRGVEPLSKTFGYNFLQI